MTYGEVEASLELRASRVDSQLTARSLKNIAPGLGPGAQHDIALIAFGCSGTCLLMATVVLVAIDLARLAILLAVDLGALLRG